MLIKKIFINYYPLMFLYNEIMNFFKEKYSTNEIIAKLACSKSSAIFLDKILEETPDIYYGIKYITLNENIFCGHFPQYPIVPGVLQMEAAFQCAIVILYDKFKLNENSNIEIYLEQINNVKFRKSIHPGDILISKLKFEDISLNHIKKATINVTNYNNCNEICSQLQMIISTRSSKDEKIKSKIDNSIIDQYKDKIDSKKILDYIPHRYPFLMIDYICNIHQIKRDNIVSDKITAVKNITNGDPSVYSYMSKNDSVLTGPIFCEIMAQAGCIQILSKNKNHDKIAMFMSIPKARFYSKIKVGSQLKLEIELPQRESRFGKGIGQAYINDILVADGEMTFAIQNK